MRIKLHNRNIYSIFAILTNQDNENMEEYKYTGPATYLSPSEGGYGMILLVNEDEVKAEVNINIATIKGVYDKYTKEYDKVKEFYVAAKYLEPVKPEPIHFDPKDDELEHESFNTEDFFDGLNESIKKFPFFGNDNDGGMVRGWDNICQRAWKKKYGDAFHMVPKDEAKKHYKPEDGSSWTAEILAGLHNKHDNDHEVGGNHYKMAIEPWDYIQANGLGFDEGNIVKYASRHKQKNGAEDIRKIISYAKHILKKQYGVD